jgi:glycosyltransferase involved in cell wall biosynthesis
MIPEMYRGMKVAVVVPARNEERLIGRTIWPVPEAVDTIYVVDDGSKDGTAKMVRHYAKFDYRIRLIRHRTNGGVGAAIITGYRQAYMDGYDIFVVVGGDAQMDWLDLDNLLKPIAEGKADYTKGNRFLYGSSKNSPGNAWREMPVRRLLGNISVSIMTKLASGYRHINDSQMGYTSMHRRVFPRVDWNKARKGYGYPAEWLIRFHSLGIRVHDVPVRAIYLRNERQTQIRLRRFVIYMMGIIIKGGLERLNREYVFGRRPLPKISLPRIDVQIGSFFRRLSLRIGSTRILNWLSGLFGFRQLASSVRLLPKMLSQTLMLEGTIGPKRNAPSLNMYGEQVKNPSIDFGFGKEVNRILREASHMIFESPLQGESAYNSLEDFRANVEKVGKTIRDQFSKIDLKSSVE